MKSDHRHELKTNELAEWLSNFPQWAREHLKMIIGVSVLVIVCPSLAYFYWHGKSAESVREQIEFTRLISNLPLRKRQILDDAQSKGVDTSYMLIQAAQNLEAAAGSAKDDPPYWRALALIKQAETLRTELHYRQGTVIQQEVEPQINQAKSIYSKVLEEATANPSLMARAKFGLGLCEEEIGNFKQAEQIYRDIAANSKFEGTVAAFQAKQRLKAMADYQQKVVFMISPKPVSTGPTGETGPAETDFIQTLLSDINFADLSISDANQNGP